VVDCRAVKKVRRRVMKEGQFTRVKKVREEQLDKFRIPEERVKFRLPGRAVQNPGATIEDREDNVSSLSGVRLCNSSARWKSK
jgi:hypothetical protein